MVIQGGYRLEWEIWEKERKQHKGGEREMRTKSEQRLSADKNLATKPKKTCPQYRWKDRERIKEKG